MDDHTLARRLADAARDLLLRLRTDRTDLHGADLGREGDRLAHGQLAAALAHHRPDDTVLSEEGGPVPTDRRTGRLWIVDPLDGTREYCDRSRGDWAVHVALADGGTLVAGAVALSSGHTHATDAPTPLPPPAHRARPRVVVSRSHRPALVDALADVLDVDLVPLGSAGVKTAAVCTGDADAYVHAGGQYEWDSAAPVAVAAAAGAHTSRIDGSPLVYATPDSGIPDLLVCRPELASTLLTALATARTRP
ncbi:inositol monophosphatase family protein [Saccharothrix yanglingensis]|uniref:inositol-phosphate phosphatase n=1 Tax=Saccharothrix yanglingensis TaxID=659496 RepID=A0ABU0X010_9PSEU|nr:inositol monophosphatase family protein [Saccharothrix yanglingensis]MDQ2584927.1 3'(2'),5'-bisphosphate nucleotidase CysQ [Saccharothrix yanglingensis]